MSVKSSSSYDLLVVTGTTASGKTSLAVALADRLGGEIISADSRQVYRGMNLGTGKDYSEYTINGKTIPCHLMDIADPGYKYNVFEYQRDFCKVYEDMKRRNIFPVVCGGSGMYVDSIVKSYRMFEVPPDPSLRKRLEKKSLEELTIILSSYKNLHNTTDIDTSKRAIRAIEIGEYNINKTGSKTCMPEMKPLIAGVYFDREARRKRITERLHRRLDEGMVEEVRSLLDSGISKEVLIYYGLEYKYITLYLTGETSFDEMVKNLETAIHQFAKRQMTWFRGMERKGVQINWIDGELPLEEKAERVMKMLISDMYPEM
ncbi:MAG: tRNA (adenosine(37)-N6)-dimethylallyltransferase MiaA [Bacteroidota bacterium]